MHTKSTHTRALRMCSTETCARVYLSVCAYDKQFNKLTKRATDRAATTTTPTTLRTGTNFGQIHSFLELYVLVSIECAKTRRKTETAKVKVIAFRCLIIWTHTANIEFYVVGNFCFVSLIRSPTRSLDHSMVKWVSLLLCVNDGQWSTKKWEE